MSVDAEHDAREESAHQIVCPDGVSVNVGCREPMSPSSPSTAIPRPGVAVGSATETEGMTSSATNGVGIPDDVCLPGSGVVESCHGPQKRLFQIWPGRNRFFCYGHLISGGENDVPCCPSPSAPNMCAWSCILIPSVVYFVVVAADMWTKAAPLVVITVMLFVITVCSLLGACFTDPGVIPRRDVVLATNERERLKECLGFDVLGDTGNGKIQDLSQEQIEALIPKDLVEKGFRWCTTCKIVRPPRSSHCSYCDNCVMRFDHHCPFVNNCVGQRNYHCFFGFVTSVGCLALFVIPSILWHLIANSGKNDEDSEGSAWLKIRYAAYFGIGCVGLAALALMALWGYHAYLLLTGQTTREHLKGKKAQNVDRTPTLCAKRGPRLFNPRALVVEGDFLRKKKRLWGRNRRQYGDEYYTNPDPIGTTEPDNPGPRDNPV